MLRGLAGKWSVVLLAVIIPGVYLQRNDSFVQLDDQLPSHLQIYRPVLQPSEAIPPIGTYVLDNLVGKPCIRATMGAEYIVTEKKKTWYFNLDPSRVKISGYCGNNTAVLCLMLSDNGASLQFTFIKEKNVSYVTKLSAHVSPEPVCPKCANKTYTGLLEHDKLFTAEDGQSFLCKSGHLFLMTSELRIKLVPLQIQAFALPSGHYGKEMECWADINERVFLIIFGAVVVGLFLITVLTFLFIKDRHRQGYERI
uniref:Lysosome-associated membrane glycoprotein 2-like luminal domain-containing protein n=1 Tax=Monopterus albus TaxID=43700 RepID=A0A3Q3K686_MONAL